MTLNFNLNYGRLVAFLSLQIAFLSCQNLQAQTTQTSIEPQVIEWKVDDTIRKALVYIPQNAKTAKTPVVFAFHGHGGTMQNMYNTRRFDQLWPEAIFICPQGLNTPGQLTDKEGKLPGWQKMEGDMNDRDLKFFDTMLAMLIKNYNIDKDRIYSTGHSNGGGFTYLLWATRGPIFAAVAPSASAATRVLNKLSPKPVLHLYGEKDELVKTEWQKNTCDALLKLNKCNIADTASFAVNATLYKSATGNPIVIYRHPGGHNYPKAANEVIVKFFKDTHK